MRAVVVQVSTPWHDEHEWLNLAAFVGDDAEEQAREFLQEKQADSRPGFEYRLDEVPLYPSASELAVMVGLSS